MNKRIKAIRKRLKKAAPGPWEIDSTIAPGHIWLKHPIGSSAHILDADDLDLIAEAPTDIEYLLGKLEKAKEALRAIAGDRPCYPCDKGIDGMPCTCFDFNPRDCADKALAKMEGEE